MAGRRFFFYGILQKRKIKIPVSGMKTDIINKIGKGKEKKWLPRIY